MLHLKMKLRNKALFLMSGRAADLPPPQFQFSARKGIKTK